MVVLSNEKVIPLDPALVFAIFRHIPDVVRIVFPNPVTSTDPAPPVTFIPIPLVVVIQRSPPEKAMLEVPFVLSVTAVLASVVSDLAPLNVIAVAVVALTFIPWLLPVAVRFPLSVIEPPVVFLISAR